MLYLIHKSFVPTNYSEFFIDRSNVFINKNPYNFLSYSSRGVRLLVRCASPAKIWKDSTPSTTDNSSCTLVEEKADFNEGVELLPVPQKSSFSKQIWSLWFESSKTEEGSGSSDEVNENEVNVIQLEIEKSNRDDRSVSEDGSDQVSPSKKKEILKLDWDYKWVSSFFSNSWDRHMWGFNALLSGFVQSMKLVEQPVKQLPALAAPYFQKKRTDNQDSVASKKQQSTDNVKAIRGSTSCKECQACSSGKLVGVKNCSLNNDENLLCNPNTPESVHPFLDPVSRGELKKVALLARLSDMAYTISYIHSGNLQKRHHLSLVTSSLELEKEKPGKKQKKGKKQEKSLKKRILDEPEAVVQTEAINEAELKFNIDYPLVREQKESEPQLDSPIVDTRQKTSSNVDQGEKPSPEPECPCDWFICDDKYTKTRYIVIQGTDSLASWQTNVTFEPVFFEDPSLGVVVHKGIYEAAKALAKSLTPLILEHLDRNGPEAKFQFTGHSLGGSLATLLFLILRIQGIIPVESVLPIYTFGAPSILCGGDRLMEKLGHSRNILRQVMLHRDIVPRAFACDYPDQVADFLKRMNGAFKEHPCLMHQRLMYSPMGSMLVLQPTKEKSPYHSLLPHRASLWEVRHPQQNNADLPDQRDRCQAEVRVVQRAILNNPHPLEILRDPGSYGPDGSISRDHDPRNYYLAVKALVEAETRKVRKIQRHRRRKTWWPPVLADPSRSRGMGHLIPVVVSAQRTSNEKIRFRGNNILSEDSRFMFPSGSREKLVEGNGAMWRVRCRKLIASHHF